MDYIILEPWARAAQSLADPMQRLAFWDAIAAFALDGREPDPADGIGVMAVAMCRRMLETHRNKVEGGRAGGRKRVENSKQTASTSQADGKQTASRRQADGKHKPSRRQADGKHKPSRRNHKER